VQRRGDRGENSLEFQAQLFSAVREILSHTTRVSAALLLPSLIVTVLLVDFTPRYFTTISIIATGNQTSKDSKGAEVRLEFPRITELELSNFMVWESTGWEEVGGIFVSRKVQPAELILRGYFPENSNLQFRKHAWSGQAQIQINGTTESLDLYARDSALEAVRLSEFLPEREASLAPVCLEFLITLIRALLVLTLSATLLRPLAQKASRIPVDLDQAVPATHLLALFFLYVFFFSGTWSGLSEMRYPFRILFPAIGILLCFFPESRQRKIIPGNFVSSMRIKGYRWQELALASLICLPSFIYLVLTWNQEFPFSGDHGLHLLSSLTIAKFWSTYVWILGGHAILGYWFFKCRYRIHWILLGYLLVFGFGWNAHPIPARYPGLDYFFSFPWMVLANQLHWDSPLNAVRLNHALSLLIWLLVLRPVFLNRRPDPSILLVAVLLFFQKDVIYYFTSSYIEPWSMILILMGLETLLCPGESWRGLAIVWIGLASMVKEISALLFPFVFLACHFSRSRKSDLAFLLLAAGVSILPFVFFLESRSQQDISRTPQLFSIQEVLSFHHFVEFLTRVKLQWEFTGLLALAVAGAIILAFWFRQSLASLRGRNQDRTATISFPLMIAGALGIALLFYFDFESQNWTGYPRFHLLSYTAILALTIPAASDLWLRSRLLYCCCVILLLILNGIPLMKTLELASRPSPYRNYVEHYEAPIFLSIRGLEEDLKARPEFQPIRSLLIVDRIYPHPMSALSEAYADLRAKYELEIRDEEDREACVCRRDDQAVFMPALIYAGLNSDPKLKELEKQLLEECRKSFERTCRNTYVQRYDGDILGISGFHLR